MTKIQQRGGKTYLLRDEFTEHHYAGAVNGTFANDDKNLRTVVDTYATTEMVLNPGFETVTAVGPPADFANWTDTAGDGNIEDSATVHAGAHANKMTGGATFNTNSNQAMTVIPGFTYNWSFWTQGDGVNAGRYWIYDVTHATDIVALVTTGVVGAAYAQVTGSFVCLAGCVSVRIYLYCPPVNGGICYFDDVSLKPTTGLLQISNLYDALGLQDRIYNGGFEIAGAGGADVFAGITETAGDGAIARTLVAGEFRSGVAACRLTSGATSNTNVYFTNVPQVIPGLEYTLSFWTRGDAVNAGWYQVWDATAGANIIATVTTGITAAVYAQVSVNFIAPVGCVMVRVYLWCPAVNGGIAYFDDVSVVQATVSAERRLVFLGGHPSAISGTPGVHWPVQVRKPGLVYLAKIQVTTAVSRVGTFGWTDTPLANYRDVFRTLSSNFYTIDNGVTGPTLFSIVLGEIYTIAVIVRTAGAVFMTKSLANPSWRIDWIATANNTSAISPVVDGNTIDWSAIHVLIPSVLWLPTPLCSDGFGRANGALGVSTGDGHAEGVAGGLGAGGAGRAWTDQIGTTLVSANTAIPSVLVGGVACATVDATLAPVILTTKLWRAAGNVGVVLAWVDANNYLRAVRTAANTQLITRVAGAEVTLINVAQVYAAAAELRVVLDGAYCAVYYNNVLAGSTVAIPAALQTGTAHGTWADDLTAGNIWDDFTIYARGGYVLPE